METIKRKQIQKVLNKIYIFVDDAKIRANVQYATDLSAKKVIHDIFYELDAFFMKLEEEIKIMEELD